MTFGLKWEQKCAKTSITEWTEPCNYILNKPFFKTTQRNQQDCKHIIFDTSKKICIEFDYDHASNESNIDVNNTRESKTPDNYHQFHWII